jgi:hypothetical protein
MEVIGFVELFSRQDAKVAKKKLAGQRRGRRE